MPLPAVMSQRWSMQSIQIASPPRDTRLNTRRLESWNSRRAPMPLAASPMAAWGSTEGWARMGMCHVRLPLRPLRSSDEAVAREAHAELIADGFSFLLGWDDRADCEANVQSKHAHARREAVPPRWVRNSFLLAESDGEVVGACRYVTHSTTSCAIKVATLGSGYAPNAEDVDSAQRCSSTRSSSPAHWVSSACS